MHLDTDIPGISRMVNQQLIYVAASRGCEDIQLFGTARAELVENLLGEEKRPPPWRLKKYERSGLFRKGTVDSQNSIVFETF